MSGRNVCRIVRAFLACALLLLAVPARAEDDSATLNLLTWQGYTDPEIAAAFTAETGCTVNAVFVGADYDFPVRLAGGGYLDFDLVSPSLDMTSVLAKLGVIEPLNPSWLSHWRDIPAAFREHPGVTDGTAVFAVPFDWGAFGLLYRADKVTDPPASFGALWDERYAGRIALWDDESSLYTAARLLFGAETDVYALSDHELASVRDKLIAQKPLLRDYWSSAGELMNLFVYGDVWLSDGWEIAVRGLKADGLPVALAAPAGTTSGFADAWQIVRESTRIDCAYAWLNFVTSPQGQCLTFRVTGFSPVNPKALAACPEVRLRGGIDDLMDLSRIDLWREPERPDRYTEVWNAVKAAQ